MKVIYIADDGTQFDDKWDCENYEWLLNHPHLKDVRCYDKDGNELKDIMSEDTYNHAEKIIVPTHEIAKELCSLGRYCGFCAYEDVTETGVWVWENGLNGKFVKV